jgi:predicted O-methyltransferase YrrM
MTSRESTRLLALPESGSGTLDPTMSDIAWRLAFGAVNWPFLAVSLWGGTKASKRRLLARVGLPDDALPNLGSWKADTGFLHRIVDAIETLRPQVVVELGAGASSLVCARALALNGGGRLVSYDQHAGFVSATADWLRDEGAHAELRHAPLSRRVPGWPGRWYALEEVPDTIDLLIIDGPPWAIHPIGRGAAECLFDRLSPGGMVLLDDAARPGERIVARRWRENWPDMEFSRLPGSTKGTLLGVKKSPGAKVLPWRTRPVAAAPSYWGRAVAAAALVGLGWAGHAALGDWSTPVQAADFIDEAEESYRASQIRQDMVSQPETLRLDRSEIVAATGIDLPQFPAGWQVMDVQVYPSDLGPAVVAVLRTVEGEEVSLFATRAETGADRLPLLERREGQPFAYWEQGVLAYALTGELSSSRVMALAASLG